MPLDEATNIIIVARVNTFQLDILFITLGKDFFKGYRNGTLISLEWVNNDVNDLHVRKQLSLTTFALLVFPGKPFGSLESVYATF